MSQSPTECGHCWLRANTLRQTYYTILYQCCDCCLLPAIVIVLCLILVCAGWESLQILYYTMILLWSAQNNQSDTGQRIRIPIITLKCRTAHYRLARLDCDREQGLLDARPVSMILSVFSQIKETYCILRYFNNPYKCLLSLNKYKNA